MSEPRATPSTPHELRRHSRVRSALARPTKPGAGARPSASSVAGQDGERGGVSLRLSQAAMVNAMALLASLAAINNITDYATNFTLVHHVLLMDSTFPGNGLRYRSITQSWVHHAGYLTLIGLQSLTALSCWIGGVRLICTRHVTDATFRSARAWAVIGLTLGFLTLQVCFMTIGGEWFGMWMSTQWNGLASAFRYCVTFLLVLIYLVMPEPGRAPGITPP